MRKVLIAVAVALAVCGQAACENAQSGADGRRVSWVVSDKARQETLSCVLTDSVPAGRWIGLVGSNLRCVLGFSVDSLTWEHSGQKGQIAIDRRYSRAEHNKNWSFFINNPIAAAGKADQEIPAGAVITAVGKMAKLVVSGSSLGFGVRSAEKWEGPWEPVSAVTAVDMVAGPPTAMDAYLRADGSAYVVYLDAYGNPALPGRRTLTIRDQVGNELGAYEVDGKAVTKIVRERLPKAVERLSVKDDQGFEALSNARSVAADGYKTYFGDLHFHSEYSGDGYRPIRDCLNSAFEDLGLDFAALGDHFTFHANHKAQEYFDVLDEFNKPGEHVTLLGYELGLGNGHMNPCYRTREQAAKFEEAWKDLWAESRNQKGRLATLEPFLKHFDPKDMFAIPHHTNHTSGPVVGNDGQPSWRNFDFRTLDVRYMPLVEICQTRGAFETEDTDPDWHVRVGGYGSSLRTALAKGLRIGFVGGSDNHHGWPTRDMNGAGVCAIAAVQARELTRDAIFDALKAKRTYATTGARILLDFRLNGKYPMGSEAKLAPTEKHTFAISVKGTAPVDRVEVISQGATIASLDTGKKLDLELTWTDPRPDAPVDDCYYYVRVRQTDGNCAWSSPIWIDCVD